MRCGLQFLLLVLQPLLLPSMAADASTPQALFPHGKWHAAIAYSKTLPTDRLLVAIQGAAPATRRYEYLVFDRAQLHAALVQRGDLAHVYEVLVEGRPCRLYFDMEFSASADRPAAAMEPLVAQLLALLNSMLEPWLGWSYEPSYSIELDASRTGDKASRRLVFHIPGYVFADTQAVRSLVVALWQRLPPDSPLRGVVDMSVYNRNQLIRGAFSSKAEDPGRPFWPTLQLGGASSVRADSRRILDCSIITAPPGHNSLSLISCDDGARQPLLQTAHVWLCLFCAPEPPLCLPAVNLYFGGAMAPAPRVLQVPAVGETGSGELGLVARLEPDRDRVTE
jgi:hypothetical protein